MNIDIKWHEPQPSPEAMRLAREALHMTSDPLYGDGISMGDVVNLAWKIEKGEPQPVLGPSPFERLHPHLAMLQQIDAEVVRRFGIPERLLTQAE
jgi:hypothetical protein